MSFQLAYGVYTAPDFINMAQQTSIDAYPKGRNISEVSQKINAAFFGGGPFASKSFSDLASIYVPSLFIDYKSLDDPTRSISIYKQVSPSALLGYVEAIPVIGSAIAAINAIYHLFGMLNANSNYKEVTNTLYEMIGTYDPTDTMIANDRMLNELHEAEKAFKSAVSYTVHQNALYASLLALIPFVKPIARIAQGTLYSQ